MSYLELKIKGAFMAKMNEFKKYAFRQEVF